MRLIDADALDDVMMRLNFKENRGITRGEYKLIDSVLFEFPTIEQPQTWIPCSERLPEEEYVLISKKPTKLSGSKWCVTIAIRMADPRSDKIHWRDIGFGVIQDNEVLAWMPLPKAYEVTE